MFAPPTGALTQPVAWSVVAGGPTRNCRRRWEMLPGSWGTPVHACPALRPRWVDLSWPPMDKPMLPSGKFTPSAPQLSPFRGSMTRPTCALSTLHDAGHPAIAQDSLPVCWLRVNWTGLAPAGFHSRISRWHCGLLSHRARLSWRSNFVRWRDPLSGRQQESRRPTRRGLPLWQKGGPFFLCSLTAPFGTEPYRPFSPAA
jgi:hypothetical protein